MTGLVKVPGLWFDDGNLILQAGSSIFKIYRGLLCARSSVFADMFAFPPPAEGNHTFEGLPIVHTYDSAQDMTCFLNALLDSEFFQPPPSPTDMPTLAGVLRLSSKYDVNHLRLRAMSHLLTTFPTNLPAWKARDAHRTIPGVENTPFAVLNLAREFDMPWLVPSAVYCISSHDINKTLEGAQWSLASTSGAVGEEPGGQVVKLGWGDQKMCIRGRHNLLVMQNKLALTLAKPARSSSLPSSTTTTPVLQPLGVATPPLTPTPNNVAPNPTGGAAANLAIPVPAPAGPALANIDPPSPGPSPCPTPTQCTHTRFRCTEILSRWGTACLIDFYREQLQAFRPGFCAGCLENFKDDCERACAEMWDALPVLFGMEDGWEEVERVRGLSMR